MKLDNRSARSIFGYPDYLKLKSFDHNLVDQSAEKISKTVKSSGAIVSGPIPLPTRRLVVPCRKSPDGEGAETWDHWEMRVHKRLLELVTSAAKDEKALRRVLRIDYPDSVTIELSLRHLG